MWIITTKGIYSVVAHRDDKDQLLVRSRSEEDIDYFKEQMDLMGFEPLSDKVYGEKFDYPWRYYCLKDDVLAVVAKMVDDIDYTNFKSAAPYERSSVLMKVYYALMAIDDREKTARIGKSISGSKPTLPSYHDPIVEDSGETAEEEQLRERIQELEVALENAAYVIEGKGPVKWAWGKLKLVDAIIRKGLWSEAPSDKLALQVKSVEDDA